MYRNSKFAFAISTAIFAFLPPASAQQLSAEEDFAFWCLSAIEFMERKKLLPEGLTKQQKTKATAKHKSVIANYNPANEISELRKSFKSEIYTVMNDWIVSKDASILRINPNQCLGLE